MDKQIMGYTQNGMLLSNKKEGLLRHATNLKLDAE